MSRMARRLKRAKGSPEATCSTPESRATLGAPESIDVPAPQKPWVGLRSQSPDAMLYSCWSLWRHLQSSGLEGTGSSMFKAAEVEEDIAGGRGKTTTGHPLVRVGLQ